ncbi:M3 family metallopeptidase [Adhaeribacter rhizoryzae]|uniref:Zn-dependent oligopeptidase n=1 Tax=Adhaeribacter rhizoryzae TaxID=2607907 RepID=A0A5M6DAI1_9BACT|nr:M3 family metallopeptidase [Adhaeribacter rhizoryzae]KAA5543292.1 Zn-dependent oligopeptidase [Adhaeribacter rhizoryzae]
MHPTINIQPIKPFLLVMALLLVFASCPATAQNSKPRNPLLPELNGVINFKAVTVADIKNATDQAIADTKANLQNIYAIKPGQHTFANTMLASDNLSDKFVSVLTGVNILANASPDTALLKQAQKSLEILDKLSNELELDEKLYAAVKAYSQSVEAKKLTGARQKFVRETIESYERNGFALTPEKRKELQEINNKISELGLAFDRNIAAHKDYLLVSEADMQGLPEDYRKSRKKEGDKYIITLDGPSYTTFMRYAVSEQARRQLYIKYYNRAADKNLDVLKQLLAERQKMANLLGYPTYAAYRTADRMVKTPDAVWQFENNLIARVKQKTQQDVAELLAVKQAYLKNPTATTLSPWETAFYNDQLMRTKYQLDQEQLKEYFALDNVLSGLFQITQNLFNIQYSEVKNASVWHPEVRLFEVKQNGATIGRFYLDLHPRDNKYTHAACFPIRKGKQYGKTYQLPTAALICNFNAPTADKPALLTHSQVNTFFHEFGHVLHNMLTKAELGSQSGTSVKRDFVEAPSQIFENWVWDYNALKLFAKHYKTGEILPAALHQKMLAARNVGSGIAASQQIFYGILDFTLHDKFNPNGTQTSTDLVKELQNSILPFSYLEGTNMQAAFGHLNGYGASYYGYLWSKVYAEDMFSVFQKNGILDAKTGARYRDIILASGASRDEYELVKEFLGREPNPEAFFKSLGI